MDIIDKKDWKALESLDIYRSQEADNTDAGGDDTLAGAMDTAPAGGSNSTDAADDAPETNEQNNDSSSNNADMGGDMGSGDESGGDDAGGGDGGDSGDAGGGDTSGGADNVDPNKNPFMGPNGKSKLDNQLAELQTAVNDTLNRVHANNNVGTVVVSDIEELADNVKNIREGVFMVPVENSLYKYKLAVVSYAMLSKQLVKDLQNNSNSSSGDDSTMEES